MGVKIHIVSIKSNPVRASSCNVIFEDTRKTFFGYQFSNSTHKKNQLDFSYIFRDRYNKKMF